MRRLVDADRHVEVGGAGDVHGHVGRRQIPQFTVQGEVVRSDDADADLPGSVEPRGDA